MQLQKVTMHMILIHALFSLVVRVNNKRFEKIVFFLPLKYQFDGL